MWMMIFKDFFFIKLIIGTWFIDLIDNFVLLTKFAGNHDLHQEWVIAKKIRKQKLATYIKKKIGYTICLDSMFDV